MTVDLSRSLIQVEAININCSRSFLFKITLVLFFTNESGELISSFLLNALVKYPYLQHEGAFGLQEAALNLENSFGKEMLQMLP